MDDHTLTITDQITYLEAVPWLYPICVAVFCRGGGFQLGDEPCYYLRDPAGQGFNNYSRAARQLPRYVYTQVM